MLAQARRVKKELFPTVLKSGRTFFGQAFYVKVLKRKDLGPSLFSFVVPAKVLKTSVGRHKLKRQMSSVVEKVLINDQKGLNIIFFVKNKPKNKIEIKQEILDLLLKVGYTS